MPVSTYVSNSSMPSESAKSVFRLDVWYNPIMEQIFKHRADYKLTTLATDADDANVQKVLGEAHAYQISSAKDETPLHWRANAALLAKTPKLLCVSTSGAGYDTVDVGACTQAGVLVLCQSGANAVSVAEHTIGLMISLSKRLSESDRRLRNETGFSRESLMGKELCGKTLGLVGIGHIGSRVARLANALDMRVLAVDPELDALTVANRGAEKVALDVLLAESDFVSLHCPRNASTEKMLDASIFVTTARGGIHSESALQEALEAGHLAGAGLDVWDVEPPPLDHPLLAMPNVVATYHTAGVTHEARRNIASWAAEQLIDTLDGNMPARLVNPEAWAKYSERYEKIFGHKCAECNPNL